MDSMAIKVQKISINDRASVQKILNRAKSDLSAAVSTVIPILQEIEKKGDSAIRSYTERFDRIQLNQFAFPVKNCDKNIEESWKKAFQKAAENIESFHKTQMPKDYEVTISGNQLGIKYSPIESVAVYAPGGKALYPSSILMGAIPARIAGVKNISLFTPPDSSGKVNPILAYVAELAGIDTIYTIGGAQAIGAAAYGTQTVKKSDFVVGPGNRYVAAAKSYLSSIGVIGIESIAGPSEVFIIADESANPEWVATDMLSQAEHGEDSVAILATTSESLAEEVEKELIKALKSRTKRKNIKEKSIHENSFLLVMKSMDECFELSNLYAPEHLEIMTKNYRKDFDKILHAGSVFLGNYSPVAMGDYISGTNHILPTAGLSRIYSPLGVDSFLKRVTYQEITPDSLRELQPYVDILSTLEGLDEEHGTSVKIRLNS